MPSKRLIRLNLGCGANKIPSYINIDVEKSVNPDRVCDFVKEPLPFKTGAVDEVVMFHTIEHIEKRKHRRIFLEINRVLKRGGVMLMSYPEFTKCAENFITNYKGMRSFWEATVFGRQLFPADFHVCAMYTPELLMTLKECGFENVEASSEAVEKHNTVVRAIKTQPFKNYEALCADDMKRTKVVLEKPRRVKVHASR